MTRFTPSLRAGITLIEMLVALIILSVLVAAIFPVVTAQVDDADPTRAANDLVSIRTGIELFSLNVRPSFPGDIEDLAHRISATLGTEDVTVDGADFVAGDVNRWKGPYIDLAVAEQNDGLQAIGDAATTGYSGTIQKDFVCYDAVINADEGTTCVEGESFVAVQVHDLSIAAFEAINDIIDGELEVDGSAANGSQVAGKFRLRDAAGTGVAVGDGTDVAYYLAVAFRD